MKIKIRFKKPEGIREKTAYVTLWWFICSFAFLFLSEIVTDLFNVESIVCKVIFFYSFTVISLYTLLLWRTFDWDFLYENVEEE